MDILQYLIELLKTKKQIGIEGLGTLYKKKTPGRYDAETHSFLPPSYVLEFTADVLESSNLVQYIQTKRSISEDSAKYFINQFVTEVQNGLQLGEYKLENFGAFTKVDGELNFIPSRDINIGFDFFALPSVTAELPKVEVPDNLEEQDKKATEEIQEEIADVTSENIPQQINEPEIEQVKVPEFEQELGKVTGEPAIVPTYEGDEPEEETSNEITTEDVAQGEEIEKEFVKVEEQTESIENNEATEEEVFEEIAEVNTIIPSTEPEPINNGTAIDEEQTETIENEEIFKEIAEVDIAIPSTETELPNKREESEDWNFDGENVVSASDIRDEEINKNEYKGASSEVDDNPIFSGQSNYNKKEDDNNIKLTATTHEWDFDSTESSSAKDDNTLIGEFDSDEIEEKIEEEKSGMPLYQKLGLTVIVLLVLLAVTYFIAPGLFESFNRNTANPDQKIAVPPIKNNLKTQQDSLSFADSIMQNAEKVGLEVQPAKDTLKATINKTEIQPTYTYDIIITSFAKEASAQQFISRMKKRGFDAKISNMEGPRKNISIATYNNIDSARKYVIKFRKQFKDPEIYIKPIKNN